MASNLKNLSEGTSNIEVDGSDFAIGILVSDYHNHITNALRDGCLNVLAAHGVESENIIVDYVPGAYELPNAAAIFLEHYDLDAVICFGCVIKGDTDHDKYINQAVSTELTRLGSEMLTPVIFGLLTVDNEQQALDRSGGKHGNKGEECAAAALKMADFYRRHSGNEEDGSTLFN